MLSFSIHPFIPELSVKNLFFFLFCNGVICLCLSLYYHWKAFLCVSNGTLRLRITIGQREISVSYVM